MRCPKVYQLMIGCEGLFFDRMFEKLEDARYFNAERFTKEESKFLLDSYLVVVANRVKEVVYLHIVGISTSFCMK